MDSTPLPLDSTTRRRRKNVSNSASSLSQSAMFAVNEVTPNAPNNTFLTREEEKNTKYSANAINTDDHITSTNNLPAAQRKKETLLSSLNKKRNDKLYSLFQSRHKKRTYTEEEEDDKTTSGDDNNIINTNDINGANDSDYNADSNNNNESNRDRLRGNVLQFASSKVNVASTSEKDAYGNDGDDTFIWKCRCSASILIAIAIWMAVMMTIFLVISDSTKTRETHALNAETAYNASLQHESYEMETKHVDRKIQSSPSLHSSSFASSTSTHSPLEKRVYTNNSFHTSHNKNNNFVESDHNNNNNKNKINNDLTINNTDKYHILRREWANTSAAEDTPLHKVNSVDDDELHGDAFDTEMKIHVCPHGSVCRERVYEDHMQRKLDEQMNEYIAQHKHTITDQDGINNNHVGNNEHQNISEDVEEVLPYSCKGRSCVENNANGLEFGVVQGSHDGVTAYSNCNYHSCYSFYDHVIEVHVHDNLKSINKAMLNENVNKARDISNTPVTLNEPLPKRMSSGMKWQCVEYARRYWMIRGKPLPAYFESVYGAADIWNFDEVLLLDGTHIPLWKFANNGSIITPKLSHDTQTDTFTDHSDLSDLLPFTSNIPIVGDLLLWERNVTADIPHGHVAVIVSVDEERHLIYVAEQNWDSTKWPAPHYNYSRSLVLSTNDEGRYVIQDDGLKLIGWVRYVVPESKLR